MSMQFPVVKGPHSSNSLRELLLRRGGYVYAYRWHQRRSGEGALNQHGDPEDFCFQSLCKKEAEPLDWIRSECQGGDHVGGPIWLRPATAFLRFATSAFISSALWERAGLAVQDQHPGAPMLLYCLRFSWQIKVGVDLVCAIFIGVVGHVGVMHP